MIIPTQKVTREQTKLHNGRLVLNTIYEHEPVSRADIARLTGLTATTVSNVAADLLENVLVEEETLSSSVRGKPPTLLRVVRDAYQLICLDVSRSSFYGAIINLRGEVLTQISIPVLRQTGDAALSLIYDLIDPLISAATSPILGIGIGAPGIIDPDTGFVHRAVNLGWYDLPLHNLLRERYNLSVHIVNAGQAAVLAEHIFGYHRNTPDLVVIKVGNDAGAGIILNGNLLLGNGFGAGEIGHIAVVENGELCRCGNVGCLETVVNNQSIVKRAQAIARDNPDSLLNRLVTSPAEIDISVVRQALIADDKTLLPIITEVGRYLGIAAASIVGVLSPPRIIIAGSVTQLGQPLLDIINQEMDNHSLSKLMSQTQVEFTSLGVDIVLKGAAALLLYHELGVGYGLSF
ncbi:MAG: ROK family transcriptional regulator [Anaerolineae bacterium]|jgi:predicted NBD/HSP70 family sugar kinase|nr:ROK family transcriptional regulator [Anaerolineae bacterium]